MIRNLAVFIYFVFFVFSCSISEDSRFKAKPRAFGVMNEVVVIADDDLWKGIVGDTIIHFFESIYPLTPRPEPLFDLRHYKLESLEKEPLKKELRTYLIVSNLSDDSSKLTQMLRKDLGEERFLKAQKDPTYQTSVGKDKWAQGQILIYVFANSPDELCKAIEENFNGISSRINEHDSEQLKQSTYARGKNLGLSTKIRANYKVDIEIPAEYVVVKESDEDKLLWLRKDYKEGTIGLIFREYKYSSAEQFTKEFAKENFNQFGKFNVSSPEAGSYLAINDIDLPILDFDRNIDGMYSKEYRGIWEMENDFMGGPFISYLLLNQTDGKIIQIDCFIYSEGKKKRNEMQQIDLMVKNAKSIKPIN